MKKYLLTYKMGIQKALTYRSVEIIWIISAFLTPLLFMTLWSRNAQSGVSSMNLSEIVTYYFLITLFSQLLSPHIEWDIARDINEGSLSNYLLKPYKYFIHQIIYELAWKTVTQIFNLIPIVIFAVIFRQYISIPQITISKIAFILMLCALSYLLTFLIQYFLGLLSFWMTQIRSFFRIYYMSTGFFSGRYFPLILMPALLIKISKYMPFQYFWYFPTMMILDKENIINKYSSLLIIFIWIIIFIFIIHFTWKKGVRDYSSYGG